MNKFLSVFCIVFALACLESRVGAVQVVFDNARDITKVVDISCEYNDDYMDFWALGCERSPSEDVYPERTGFWTGCNRQCELVYHGGLLPKPAKLRIETYMEGLNYISISGKNNPTDNDFEHDFGWIDSVEAEWCYREIDLSEYPGAEETKLINFNVSASSMGFVLIDRIIVDLGDVPIDPITIESKKDELPMHWSYDDCHHLDEYSDFWSFGCPVEPVEENPQPGTIGYWSPCQDASCRIEFSTSPSIIPTMVTIRGYLEDDAQIKVVVPPSSTNTSAIVIETISATTLGGWVDFDVDLSAYQAYKVDIVLESNGGTVVLDSLSYSFDNEKKSQDQRQSELPMCVQKQATTPTTTTTTTQPTTTLNTAPTTLNTAPTTTGPPVTTPSGPPVTTPTGPPVTTTGQPATTPTVPTVTSTEPEGTTNSGSMAMISVIALYACVAVLMTLQ